MVNFLCISRDTGRVRRDHDMRTNNPHIIGAHETRGEAPRDQFITARNEQGQFVSLGGRDYSWSKEYGGKEYCGSKDYGDIGSNGGNGGKDCGGKD